MTELKIGLIINPIAGVGASLAWKGTDDVEAAWDVVETGGEQPVWNIVKRALASLPSHVGIKWFLGADYNLDLEATVVSSMPARSHANDTKIAVKAMNDLSLDLILFAGGDGTAADVANSSAVPILGIPAGVKIYSPVFVHRPEDLGSFLKNWEGDTTQVDLLDLDEDAYRRGEVEVKLITSASIPVSSMIQAGKISWTAPDSATFELIAERIQEEGWLLQTLAVGPGSTMQSIFSCLGLDLSLLGVDIIQNGDIKLLDATKEQLDSTEIDEIWVTPIGNQGHIFGRGNRQLSSNLIARAKIRVFATMDKARETEVLYVDTGDPELDDKLRGFLPVVVGYHEEIMKRVR